MEVRNISQGRQTTLNSVQISNKDSQVKNNNIPTDEGLKLQNKSHSKNDIENLKRSVNRLNGFMKNDDIRVVYEAHEKFRKDVMIKVVDNITEEIISEIPPEKILDLVAKMCEMVGVLFDKKA